MPIFGLLEIELPNTSAKKTPIIKKNYALFCKKSTLLQILTCFNTAVEFIFEDILCRPIFIVVINVRNKAQNLKHLRI